jgi:deoxyribodipyrimidine photo-lyase
MHYPETPTNFHPSPACIRLKDKTRIVLDTVPLNGPQLPGELAALECMHHFFASGLKDYKTQRDYPSKKSVSRLAPYLRFGELSVRTLWHRVAQYTQRYPESVETFCSELGWREFAYYLLHHFPYIPTQNHRTYFDHFPWEENPTFLHAWQTGQTGYPLVDAGMRELSQTGSMHNRIRMVVGSFLIKNLNIHWHHGRDWFWEHLYDADLASNSMNWQWVAGTGFDAQPYIRIFNPTLQAEKFDADGTYIRHFIPELRAMPISYLFEPWKAPQGILQNAHVQLGTTYPWPIIDLAQSRARALQAYATCQPPTGLNSTTPVISRE